MKVWTNCGISVPWYSSKKLKELLIYAKGQMSRELCWVKKGNTKRMHTILFYLYSRLEMIKLGKWRRLSGIKESIGQEGSSSDHKGNIRDPCCNGSFLLYLDFINDNILVAILLYNFLRCCHWGKLEYVESLCTISHTFISYNDFKIESIIWKYHKEKMSESLNII